MKLATITIIRGGGARFSLPTDHIGYVVYMIYEKVAPCCMNPIIVDIFRNKRIVSR
jgi:hypothetical protein